MKRPDLSDVYVLEDSSYRLIDEELSCSTCGEEFVLGDKAVDVPWDSRRLVSVHLHCAVQQDEIDVTNG